MRRILHLGICGLACGLPLALASCVVAEEKDSNDSAQPAAAAENAPPNEADRERYIKMVRELQKQQEEFQKHVQEFQKHEKEFAEQRSQLEQQRAQLAQFERQRAQLLEEQRTRSEIELKMFNNMQQRRNPDGAEQPARQLELELQPAKWAQMFLEQQAKAAPLPEDAVLRAFKLQYVQPEEIGQALRNITGGSGPRIAIDERTNALLIAGNDKQMSVAEQLVKTLDQPGKSQQNKAPETLQLRIVWLLDAADTVGKEPTPHLVSAPVLDALGELGFETPRVVCQQVTTLTLNQENRRGKFHFAVPVLVDAEPWQFQGQGMIMPTADERYSLEFSLDVQPSNGGPRNGQISGSIFTPLGHYTVMGTTTFVGTTLIPRAPKDPAATPVGAEGAAKSGGGTITQQEQHLSAFVVYLDRAREFPGGDEKPTDNSGRRR